MSAAPVPSAVSRNWIAGQWSTAGTTEESVDPSTGAVVGRYVSAGREQAAEAVAAARGAFTSGPWSRSALLRSQALIELAGNLEAQLPQIAAMLSREGGKRLPETMWEVGGAAAWLRYSAATALTQNAGRAAEVTPGTYFTSMPEPLGVAGIISPWNSPVILTARALGPALAAGCTAVVKLPGQTGLTNTLFAEAVAATASLPPGVVSMFSEAGNEAAPLLVESPDVAVISYTGSTDVGRTIAANSAKTLKHLNLELGGKTPLIVFDDADLDQTLPMLVRALVTMNGQFCVTGSRVLVQRGIADEVRGRLSEMLSSVRVGPADDPASELGPLIDAASAARLDQMVEDASSYAKVLVRGGLVHEGPLASGAYFRPALLEVEDMDVPLVQQELFGPVQTFEVFEDDADAVRRANGTDYGLAASVFSGSSVRAREVAREVSAAAIWINTWALISEHFEQGGFKASGLGYLCGPHAIETFQQLKVYSESTPTAAQAMTDGAQAMAAAAAAMGRGAQAAVEDAQAVLQGAPTSAAAGGAPDGTAG